MVEPDPGLQAAGLERRPLMAKFRHFRSMPLEVPAAKDRRYRSDETRSLKPLEGQIQKRAERFMRAIPGLTGPVTPLALLPGL